MERLKPVRQEGFRDPMIDIGQLYQGLVGDGVLLEDLQQYRFFRVAPGITVSELIYYSLLFDKVQVVDTPEGQALKYLDRKEEEEIERILRERREAAQRASSILRQRGIIKDQ